MSSGRSLVVRCAGVEVGNLTPNRATTLFSGEIHAWFATMDQLRKKADHYWDLLDDAEQVRADRFRFEKDKERFVLGHGLLRELLGSYLNIGPRSVTMARGTYGKPFLENSTLYFNLSDTKDAVFIAFTHENEIGADVETLTRNVDHVSVSQYYFTPEEVSEIEAATNGKRRFLELWTRKEAVLKASGVGIMDDLSILRVNGECNENSITHDAFVQMAAPEYFLRTFTFGKDHLVSLASPVGLERVQLFTPLLPKTSGEN